MSTSRMTSARLLARNLMTVSLLVSSIMISAATAKAADTAYIQQIPSGAVTIQPMTNARPVQNVNQPVAPSHSNRTSSPEAYTPLHGENLTQTLQVGANNSTYHIQAGGNNTSAAGVFGYNNNVAVLQAGNNLKSNVVLLNTVGMNVGVIQPNGSAPVNVLIARLPGGGLLIKR